MYIIIITIMIILWWWWLLLLLLLFLYMFIIIYLCRNNVYIYIHIYIHTDIQYVWYIYIHSVYCIYIYIFIYTMGYTPVRLRSPLPGAPKLGWGASASGGCLQPSLPKGAQGRSGARSLRRQAVAAVARRKNGPWNPQVGKKTLKKHLQIG